MRINWNDQQYTRFMPHTNGQSCHFLSKIFVNRVELPFIGPIHPLAYSIIEGRVVQVPVVCPYTGLVSHLWPVAPMQQTHTQPIFTHLLPSSVVVHPQQAQTNDFNSRYENQPKQQNQANKIEENLSRNSNSGPPFIPNDQPRPSKVLKIENCLQIQYPYKSNNNSLIEFSDKPIISSHLTVAINNSPSQLRKHNISQSNTSHVLPSLKLENPLDSLLINDNSEFVANKIDRTNTPKHEIIDRNRLSRQPECQVLLLKLTTSELLEKAASKLKFKWVHNRDLTLHVFLRKKQIYKIGKKTTEVLKILDYSRLDVKATQE